ncbi:hypothetical protein [Nostoc commune]|uniref:hypothetical protein n=1 Tax=Nostoc commune TaxID=1178 RepID=UPI0018C85AEF|nr:hypothetical protein [Nostoc commune]MBG1262137.1 hypothetical protein [Nostoc commune BAE]
MEEGVRSLILRLLKRLFGEIAEKQLEALALAFFIQLFVLYLKNYIDYGNGDCLLTSFSSYKVNASKWITIFDSPL